MSLHSWPSRTGRSIVGSDGQDLNFLEAFYRPRLVRGEIGFPDIYVVFGANMDALRQRKQADQKRQRRGFETHLRFIEPQRRYFGAIQRFSPDRVRFLNARDVGQSARAVAAAARQTGSEARPVELFDRIIRWLRQSPAAQHADAGDNAPT